MISRQWRGIAKSSEVENYKDLLKKDTFPKLKEIKGFIGSSILSRVVSNGMEFLIVTEWESIESIKEFAGNNFEVAVVPEIVQSMMLEFDHICSHYEIEFNTDRN
jgi:hypothetical protein